MTGSDPADLSSWVGRSQSQSDILRPWPAAALAAALGRARLPAEGDPLPPFWHQLYFLPIVSAAETGPDGHARRGGFLPPVPLPRRMWAGGRLTFHRPLLIGDAVERRSTLRQVASKTGRTGPLAFVTVLHEVSNEGGLAVSEEHDIVYRELGTPAAAPIEAPGSPVWQRRLTPDEVLLFRYSALTANGHRIHYDQPYATGVEGYAGLVVHGPLLATLMLELLHDRQPDARLRRFAFRAHAPAIVGNELSIEGDGSAALWIRDAGHRLLMRAHYEL